MYGETLKLEWADVDLKHGVITLPAERSKNRKSRKFVMTTVLRALLEERHRERQRMKKAGHIVPWVFWREVAQGRGGAKKPRPIKSIGKAFARTCDKAGYPGKIPHDLRRSAIRRFVRAGLSETVAMRLSGHRTASTFRRYDITSEEDLVDAARTLDAAQGTATDNAASK